MLFNDDIAELEKSGYKVFGKRVYKKLKETDEELWSFAYLSVISSSNPDIIDLDEIRKSFDADLIADK